MRTFALLSLIVLTLFACKNNGQQTAKAIAEKPTVPKVKDIIVGADRKPTKEPDFQVLEMTNANDVLTVIVRYSGGCKEHGLNAYFSGAWAKSLPPQAMIDLEHLNPDNDACRSLVRDTFQFNMKPLQYAGAKEVIVKWQANPKVQTSYVYGE